MFKTNRKYSLLSLTFILTPPLATGLIGVLARSQTVDTLRAVISDILIPTMAATCLAAVIGWAVFLRRVQHPSGGQKAGLLTVSLCYLFGILPLAIVAGSWDGTMGVIVTYLTIFFFGHLATFWITYPIGIIFGRWIAGRMV